MKSSDGGGAREHPASLAHPQLLAARAARDDDRERRRRAPDAQPIARGQVRAAAAAAPRCDVEAFRLRRRTVDMFRSGFYG